MNPTKSTSAKAPAKADPWKPYGDAFKSNALKIGYTVNANPKDVQKHMAEWERRRPVAKSQSDDDRAAHQDALTKWNAERLAAVDAFNAKWDGTDTRPPGWSRYGMGGGELDRDVVKQVKDAAKAGVSWNAVSSILAKQGYDRPTRLKFKKYYEGA